MSTTEKSGLLPKCENRVLGRGTPRNFRILGAVMRGVQVMGGRDENVCAYCSFHGHSNGTFAQYYEQQRIFTEIWHCFAFMLYSYAFSQLRDMLPVLTAFKL